MTLGDEFISAAIKYQTAVSKFQRNNGYDLKLDLLVKETFASLCSQGMKIDKIVGTQACRIKELEENLNDCMQFKETGE